MDNKIEQMLAGEIEATLKELKTLDASSDKAKAVLVKLSNLQNQRKIELDALLKDKQRMEEAISKSDENEQRMAELEQKRLQTENELKLRTAELEQRRAQAEHELEMKKDELAQKEAELKEAKKSRRWKTAVDVLGISLPIGVGLYGLIKGFEFEEEGKIYSSRTTQFVSGFLRLFSKKG